MQQLPDQKTPMGALILIIGSASIIRFFSAILKVPGYTIRGCQYSSEQCNPKMIVTIARDTKPSLILLEVNALNDDDLLLFQQLREAGPQTCPILVVTEQANDQKFQNIDATSLISWPCDISTVLDQVNALIGHLNPRLSQPRRGFLYPVHNPPSDLPEGFR